MRRRWRVLGRTVFVVAAAGVGLGAFVAWRYEAARDEAVRSIASGRHAEARRQLARLSSLWPGRGDVEYHLGICEQATGRPDAALAAWERAPSSSPHARQAASRRARLLIAHRGRFALAESILEDALRGDGPGAHEARQVLSRLYRLQGRHHDARRLLQEAWASAPNPAVVLRDLWQLDTEPMPSDLVAEQRPLTGLVELDSGNTLALDRLADLAVRSGEEHRVEELRRRKDESDEARDRCRKLLSARSLVPHARELARLAETLGRRFEARGWWTLAEGQDVEAREAQARLGPSGSQSLPHGRTLADSLADISSWPRAGIETSHPPVLCFSHPASRTTPRRPASASFMTTAGRRPASSPRPWGAGSACSTTTATAGSTSTSPTTRRRTSCSAI